MSTDRCSRDVPPPGSVADWCGADMEDDTDFSWLMIQIPGVSYRELETESDETVGRLESQRSWSIRAAMNVLNNLGTVLYAVQLPDGLIKIGYTGDLWNRIKSMAGIKTSKLLAVRFGDMADENALHKSLTAYVAHGREYYHPTPEVLAVINEWRQALGLAPI